LKKYFPPFNYYYPQGINIAYIQNYNQKNETQANLGNLDWEKKKKQMDFCVVVNSMRATHVMVCRENWGGEREKNEVNGGDLHNKVSVLSPSPLPHDHDLPLPLWAVGGKSRLFV